MGKQFAESQLIHSSSEPANTKQQHPIDRSELINEIPAR